MGRRRSSDDGIFVEEWEGHPLFVDREGTFYTPATGERTAEAKTLSKLKAALAPAVKLSLRGVRFDHWHDEKVRPLTVVGLTTGGRFTVRHDDDRPHDRATTLSSYDKVYVYDEARIAEHSRLVKAKTKAEKALRDFRDNWPTITPASLRGKAPAAKEAP